MLGPCYFGGCSALLLQARILGDYPQSPILNLYIDWSIKVPLQMIEFNLILNGGEARPLSRRL